MSTRIEQLAEQLDSLRAEIAELDTAENLTDEQAARFAAALDEWDTAKAEHDRLAERAAKVEAIRAAALQPRNVEPAFAPVQVMTRRDPFEGMDAVRRGLVDGDELIARAGTAIERLDVRGIGDDARQRATVLAESDPALARHMLLTGSRAYFEAFRTILRHGPLVGATLLDEAQRTALSNTSANGGYTNPWFLDPTVILTNDGIAGPIRSVAQVVTIATDKWEGITSAGVTAEWLGEGSEAADKSPTVGQPSITPIKGAAYVFASYEQEADGQLVAQLPRLIADAKSRLEEAAFATGAGSTSAPKGVITALAAVTASRVSPTTGGTFSAASEVYKVANAVPARHASNAVWIANKTTINTIRGFDTYGGSSFLANLQMGQPPLLLGQPLLEVSTMTATVTTGSNLLAAFDPSEYVIVDRVGTEMRYDPIVVGSNQRPTGQSGWFAFWRTGADLVNTNAGRVLQL